MSSQIFKKEEEKINRNKRLTSSTSMPGLDSTVVSTTSPISIPFISDADGKVLSSNSAESSISSSAGDAKPHRYLLARPRAHSENSDCDMSVWLPEMISDDLEKMI
jgi:hypothetical protein